MRSTVLAPLADFRVWVCMHSTLFKNGKVVLVGMGEFSQAQTQKPTISTNLSFRFLWHGGTECGHMKR